MNLASHAANLTWIDWLIMLVYFVFVLGIGFALATMAGFLISVEHGLFGFTDSWAAPFAGLAFTIEIATVAALAVAAVVCLTRSAA